MDNKTKDRISKWFDQSDNYDDFIVYALRYKFYKNEGNKDKFYYNLQNVLSILEGIYLEYGQITNTHKKIDDIFYKKLYEQFELTNPIWVKFHKVMCGIKNKTIKNLNEKLLNLVLLFCQQIKKGKLPEGFLSGSCGNLFCEAEINGYKFLEDEKEFYLEIGEFGTKYCIKDLKKIETEAKRLLKITKNFRKVI